MNTVQSSVHCIMHSYPKLKSDCHPNSRKGFIIILDDKDETLGRYVIFMQLYDQIVIKMETSNCRNYVLGKSCIKGCSVGF